VIDRLIEIGRFYGIEMNMEETLGNENLKTTIFSSGYDSSKTTGECGKFQLLGLMKFP
jgi:hypothetical protein